ncbi:MAG: VOC family protein [Pseudomonadota bacterium]
MRDTQITPHARAALPAAATASIGHVHLRVADLDRAIAFYSDILGLDVMQRLDSGAAFLSMGGYHHHVGLNTWESLGASPPPKGHTGLYHTAFLYPSRAELARIVARVVDAGIQIIGKADHGVSEAVYLNDPDRNGVELYRDRPESGWPRDAEGRLSMVNAPLDVEALVAEGRAL